MNKEDKKYPKIAVGAFIFNKKGELFLMRSPHWSDKLVVPGGHVEHGEQIEEALIREVKEETGLDITGLEFLTVEQIMNSPDYIKNKHVICLDYKASLAQEKQEVQLDNREAVEYFWFKIKEALQREDLEVATRQVIESHLSKKQKKLSAKKCKNCEQARQECEEYKMGWQRALADYKNLQTEIDNKKSEWIKMSAVQILEEFIPVYEHLKLAVAGVKTAGSDNPWLEGVKYVVKQFQDILRSHGVEEIQTVGEKFNPLVHEAVGQEDSDQPAEIVVKEVGAGYKMGDKVLRAAKVIISK